MEGHGQELNVDPKSREKAGKGGAMVLFIPLEERARERRLRVRLRAGLPVEPRAGGRSQAAGGARRTPWWPHQGSGQRDGLWLAEQWSPEVSMSSSLEEGEGSADPETLDRSG